MARPDKAAAVAELADHFRDSNAAVLTEYRGLTVAQLKDLRRALGATTQYAVVKNTLTKVAAREAGFAGLDETALKGPSAIAFIKGDPVEAAKGLRDFELKDELYYNLQMKHRIDPLATTDYNNGTWPVAWTRTYGAGRVFHTPLGHRDFGPGKDDPLSNPNLRKLVLQGVDWVAEGRHPRGGEEGTSKPE